MIIGDYSEDLPLITAAADKVCNDIIFKDQAGKLSRGTRVCAPAEEVADAPQPCSPTQIAPCIVDGTDYQAVALASLLATDIRDASAFTAKCYNNRVAAAVTFQSDKTFR